MPVLPGWAAMELRTAQLTILPFPEATAFQRAGRGCRGTVEETTSPYLKRFAFEKRKSRSN
jgi:hypothetical protein